MTITQIECFVEAANMGSISKAGTNLFISQQTISRQIKALETELDMPLFERMNRAVSLTIIPLVFYSVNHFLIIFSLASEQQRLNFTLL